MNITKRECLAKDNILESDSSLRSLVDWSSVDTECDCSKHYEQEPLELKPLRESSTSPVMVRMNKKRRLLKQFMNDEISYADYDEELNKLFPLTIK